LLSQETEFDYLCLPVGTGGTIAGIISGLNANRKIIGFPVLKGAQFLETEVRSYTDKENWQLIYNYHFGGYAKSTKELIDFMDGFERVHHIPLDPIYTSKMIFGIFDLVRKRFFETGSSIMVLHTGGLQGRRTD